MAGGLKLAGEVVLFVIATGLTYRVFARRRVRMRLDAALVVVVVLTCTALAVAGVAVSGKRAIQTYRDDSRLTTRERLTAAAAKVTSALVATGAIRSPSGAAVQQQEPEWISFVEWLRSRMPSHSTFTVITSPAAERSTFRFWLNWRLLPRTQAGSARDANWIVYFDVNPPPAARGVVRFTQMFALVRGHKGG